MTTPQAATRSVIVERDFPHPPEKVWRALTESNLMEQWLMKNDFELVAGRAFTLRRDPVPGWDGIIDCKVIALEPCKSLSYVWASMGLETVVSWALTRTGAGTHLRMEQSGFALDRDQNYKGATYGWRSFIGKLEQVVTALE
jgi:uncharacterized protein YndB with AHSA1/START domain